MSKQELTRVRDLQHFLESCYLQCNQRLFPYQEINSSVQFKVFNVKNYGTVCPKLKVNFRKWGFIPEENSFQNICKRVTPLFSSDESGSLERREEWKFEDKENILNIKTFIEQLGIKGLVLRRLIFTDESNFPPLYAFKQMLNADCFDMIIQKQMDMHRKWLQMRKPLKVKNGVEKMKNSHYKSRIANIFCTICYNVASEKVFYRYV